MTGDVLEGLFEYVTTSNRFRTTSSSSASFAVPSLSTCDIFPEIAGVVSASDSDTDVSEYLAHGNECLQLGDVIFSPPQPKLRQNSDKLFQRDVAHPSIVEMLDTLCYSTQDLTHINNIVENVVLDWRRGTAVENCSTANEVIVETEPAGQNDLINCDNLPITGYIATLSEGNLH